jgi:DNA-binding NtrC family response regulator
MVGDLLKTAQLQSESRKNGVEAQTFLIRLAASHRPLHPSPAIIPLEEQNEVLLGRGDRHSLVAEDSGTLTVRVGDPAMSSRHARLRRLPVGESGTFMIEDLGSTNGCRVNGGRVTQPVLLCHGDLIETGQTFWKFHEKLVVDLGQVLAQAYSSGPIGPMSTIALDLLTHLAQVERVAPSEIPLILTGESGSGKEVLAREIHRLSGRVGPYLAINCAAIPEGLIESELFGHRRGAFTGAVADKRGIIEEAHQGTLLLDEVGDMPLAAQAKLLRVLQERRVTPVGETNGRAVDVRFLAATHRDLRGMVDDECFRGDLYARLNGFLLDLPPLRERKEDLGIFVSSFLSQSGGFDEQQGVSREFVRALLLYDWPFNIRELEKTISVALTLAAGERLEVKHLPESVRSSRARDPENTSEATGVRQRRIVAETDSSGTVPPDSAESESAEIPRRRPRERWTDNELRSAIVRLLDENGGNISAVARELSTTRMQVHRWMKKLEIDHEGYRG